MDKNLITYSRLARICGVHRMTIFQAVRNGGLIAAHTGGKVDLDHPATQEYIVNHMGPKTLGRPRSKRVTDDPTGTRPDPPAAPIFAPVTGGPSATPGPAGPLTQEALAAWIANAGPRPRAWKLARDFGVAINVAKGILSDLQKEPGPEGGPENSKIANTASAVMPSRGDSVDKFLDMTLRELRHSFGLPESMLTWLEIRRKAEDLRGREIKNNETVGSLIPRDLVRIHVFGALEQLALRLLTDTPQTLSRRIYALAKADADPAEAQALAAEVIGTQIRNAKQVMVDNLDRIQNG